MSSRTNPHHPTKTSMSSSTHLRFERIGWYEKWCWRPKSHFRNQRCKNDDDCRTIVKGGVKHQHVGCERDVCNVRCMSCDGNLTKGVKHGGHKAGCMDCNYEARTSTDRATYTGCLRNGPPESEPRPKVSKGFFSAIKNALHASKKKTASYCYATGRYKRTWDGKTTLHADYQCHNAHPRDTLAKHVRLPTLPKDTTDLVGRDGEHAIVDDCQCKKCRPTGPWGTLTRTPGGEYVEVRPDRQ